jgi:oxygen-independent coproporphyrinogen-3 oxidase
MSGIYIHIPFCDTKCVYCDFYSITNRKRKEEFIDTLIMEIIQGGKPPCSTKDIEQGSLLPCCDSIYFGGGTPSLLSYEDFNKIFDTLHRNFQISDNAEITIEANPGTLNEKKLREFRKLPINRISFGVQSFKDEELKFLTRIHTSEQASRAVMSAQDAGYENINIDLIYAIPGQTLDTWKYNLEKAVSLNTQHISAYSLIFEEGTPLMKMLDKKADEDLEAEMYEYAIDYLTQEVSSGEGVPVGRGGSFVQYEISNFAKPGFECRHNLKYWNYEEYIGFGPSAASFVGNRRWVNVRNLNQYIDRINGKVSPIDFSETIDGATSMNEFVFLGLRSGGVNVTRFRKKYREDFLQRYKNSTVQLIKRRMAVMDKDVFRLTKEGYRLCDEIIVNYF